MKVEKNTKYFVQYYQTREEKIIEQANREAQSGRLQAQDIIQDAGFSVTPTGDIVPTGDILVPESMNFKALSEIFSMKNKNLAFISFTNNTRYCLSPSINEFRIKFFSDLYNMGHRSVSPFSESLGKFEFAIISAVIPNQEEIGSGAGSENVKKFFKEKRQKFLELESNFRPFWIFDTTCSKQTIHKSVMKLINYLGDIIGLVEKRYEILLHDVKIQEGTDDCLGYCLPCFFAKKGEIETGILAVKAAHISRIRTDMNEIQCSFKELQNIYETDILNTVSMKVEGEEELQAMGEGTPLLGSYLRDQSETRL